MAMADYKPNTEPEKDTSGQSKANNDQTEAGYGRYYGYPYGYWKRIMDNFIATPQTTYGSFYNPALTYGAYGNRFLYKREAEAEAEPWFFAAHQIYGNRRYYDGYRPRYNYYGNRYYYGYFYYY